MLDTSGKTNVLPVFPSMVGEVMNGIMDLIDTAADPARNKRLLMKAKIVPMTRVYNVLQRNNEKDKKTIWQPMIIATFWNRIAKKIDMGDNLEGHEGFLIETACLIR